MKPILPKNMRKRPSLKATTVVATNKGWVALHDTKDQNELLSECPGLYSTLETHNLLLPCDYEFAGAEISVEEASAPIIDPEVVDPEVVDPEVVDPEVVDPEVVDPEVVEIEIEPTEVEVTEPEVTEPTNVKDELVDLEKLQEVDKKTLEKYSAAEVVKFATDNGLGKPTTKKQAIAAILEVMGA